MTRRLLALGAALWIGAAGCQGTGVAPLEISPDPIAILYRTPEQARRLAEMLQREDPSPPSLRQGVAPVDEIARYVTGLFGARPREERAFRGQLALLDPRTGAVRVLRSALPGAIPQDWSADHQRLLFAQRAGDGIQLFEFDRVAREVRAVTHGPRAHPAGCYGPDRRLVLMAVDPRRQPVSAAILLTEPGGGNPQRISRAAVAHSPACAPDGSAVAYVSAPSGGEERIAVRAPVERGTERPIAPGREPAFTPDGGWIVYSAPVRGGWKLWRVRPDGTGRAPIGRGVLDERRPAVSPDGRLIAYVGETEGRPWLYLRRFDGTGDRILFSDGDGDHPAW